MSIFEKIKQSLNLKEVAEFYGIVINRSGFVSCLFHDDKTPSMKLYDDHFYCFGCQKCGDVISLVAQLHDVSQYDSAKIIMRDFGLDDSNFKPKPVIKTKFNHKDKLLKNVVSEIKMLNKYLSYLQSQKMFFTPKSVDDELSTDFLKCQNLISQVHNYLDVLSMADFGTCERFLSEHSNELKLIRKTLMTAKKSTSR
ncbi:MAG: CHC2 zinc finger domain-containing protein [Clostridia bacterium]